MTRTLCAACAERHDRVGVHALILALLWAELDREPDERLLNSSVWGGSESEYEQLLRRAIDDVEQQEAGQQEVRDRWGSKVTAQTLFIPPMDIEVGDQIVSTGHTIIGTVAAVQIDPTCVHVAGVGFVLDLDRNSLQCVVRAAAAKEDRR